MNAAFVPSCADECRHCGEAIRPERWSLTGWAHSRNGIIVCAGQEHYAMSAVRKAAEPLPASDAASGGAS